MGALKRVLINRELRINAKCMYEGAVVPTALYGDEAWGIKNAEKGKVNLLEMMCLSSLVGVTWIVTVRNEEVHERTGIELLLDQIVLRWFRPVERIDSALKLRRVLMKVVNGGRVQGIQRYTLYPPSIHYRVKIRPGQNSDLTASKLATLRLVVTVSTSCCNPV